VFYNHNVASIRKDLDFKPLLKVETIAATVLANFLDALTTAM
jgi:hypothetical protein